jgi:hypothetical protein
MKNTFEKNISELILDKAIKDEVESMGVFFPYKVTMKQTLPLTKARTLSLSEIDIESFPPIRIDTEGNILDGRHRTSLAIVKGKKTIKATYGSIKYCENDECSKKLILATKNSLHKELLCEICFDTKCCMKCTVWCGETLCDKC